MKPIFVICYHHPPTISSLLEKEGRIKEGGACHLFVMLLFIMALCAPLAHAANESKSESQTVAERTRAIAAQLSCVVCSGQSVASSNAALAQDMRAFIATKLREGESPAEIKAFLRRRYGDKILMRPPVKPATYLLWAAPVMALLAGLGIIYAFYRRVRRT